jgi:hypothetical protein
MAHVHLQVSTLLHSVDHDICYTQYHLLGTLETLFKIRLFCCASRSYSRRFVMKVQNKAARIRLDEALCLFNHVVLLFAIRVQEKSVEK